MRDRSGYSPQPAGSTSRKRALVSLAALACLTAGCAQQAHRDAGVVRAAPASTGEPAPERARAPLASAPAASAPAARSETHAATVVPAPRPSSAVAASAASAVALPAPPQILSVSASPRVVRDGQAVVWDVRTTADIVRVTASTTMIVLPLQRFSPGHFGLTFSIPHGVPGFFHGTYNMDVSAVSAGGTTLHRGIALTFL